MLCSVLMHCYLRRGHGARFTSSISKKVRKAIGTLFVDDTDLHIFNKAFKTSEEVFKEMQKSTDTWCELLNSTGGSAKPEKCAWWLVDYKNIDGVWSYDTEVTWELYVPLPDGTHASIENKGPTESVETLGVWSCPAGLDDKQLKKIYDKCETWVTRTSNGHLPAKYSWVSYRLKLWPAIRYGLATMATPFIVADKLLRDLE